MLKFRTVAVLLLCVRVAFSAGVRGRVIDPAGLAVDGATVTMTSNDGAFRRSLFTDSSGGFSAGSIPSGLYLVEAHAAELQSRGALQIVLPLTEPLEIQLEVARVRTSVQVTASATAQPAGEASKTIDVIDSEQLESRAEITVVESLRLVPGIRVQQLGGPASTARIQSRGMRSFDTSVLIDGFRFRDAASTQGDSAGFLSDLVLIDTDRLEVLRGSGASLYGSHASAAVVNIVTAAGGGPIHGDITAEGGGLGLMRGVGRMAGGIWNDRVRYSGGVSHLNISSGVDGQDSSRNTGGHGSVQIMLRPGTLLSSRVFATEAYLDLNDTPFPAPASELPPNPIVPARPGVTFTPALNDPDQRRIGGFVSLLTGITQQLGARASLRIYHQGASTRREFRDGPVGLRFEPDFPTLSAFSGRIDTISARTDWHVSPSQAVTAGYEWEREWFDNFSRDQNPDPAQRVAARSTVVQRSNSVFAQDQLRFFRSRLLLSLSGRWQQFALGTPRFEGGLGAYAGVTSPSPRRALTGDASVAYLFASTATKLRAHVGNGYRAPSLYERFGTFFFGAFSPFGDPRLRPERLISMDGGVDQYLFANKLRVRATLFYTRIQEAIAFEQAGVIVPANDPYGRFGGYWNTGGGLARGVEFSADVQPARATSISSSYTYTNADERISVLVGGLLQSPRALDHAFSLLATQRLGRRFEASADFMAGSDYLNPLSRRAFRFEGPRKLDLALSYTHFLSDKVRARFYSRIENLLNRTYYEDGFLTPGRWATVGLKLTF